MNTSIINITTRSVVLSQEQLKRQQWWLKKRHIWLISHESQALTRQKRERCELLQFLRYKKRQLTLYIPQLPTSSTSVISRIPTPVISRHISSFQSRFAELSCKNMDQLRQICRDKNYFKFSQLTKTHLIHHIMYFQNSDFHN